MSDLPADERRIPLERTSVPYSVNQTFNDATDVVASPRHRRRSTTWSRASPTSPPTAGPGWSASCGGWRTVARAFNEREDVIDELLDNSQVLTDTLADKDERSSALIDASEVVLDQIAARRDELAAVLGDGSAVVTHDERPARPRSERSWTGS